MIRTTVTTAGILPLVLAPFAGTHSFFLCLGEVMSYTSYLGWLHQASMFGGFTAVHTAVSCLTFS